MEKRHTQTTAQNGPRKIIVIERCIDCKNLFKTMCELTGRTGIYAVSGPIPEDCPLPDWRDKAEK